MNLFHTIKQSLKQISEDEVLRNMGYNNLQKGNKTLKQFLDTGNIYLWLKKGEYDLKYTSKQFLEKLIEALDLTSIGKDELNQYYRRLDAIRAMRNTPYIFIDTHFKRKGETILSLAFMECRRNIHIDKELLVYKTESEVIDIIGKIVKNHYLVSEEKIQLWGKIHNYVYLHTDGNRYVFNTNGTLSLGNSEISESRAEIRIGNQIIVGMSNE